MIEAYVKGKSRSLVREGGCWRGHCMDCGQEEVEFPKSREGERGALWLRHSFWLKGIEAYSKQLNERVYYWRMC